MTRRAAPYVSLKRFGLPDISMPAIRRYARRIAERFKPDKIILFGSFAYGEPNEHSDVDLLVVMPCPHHATQAHRIRLALRAPFAMDLIVRTPKALRERLAMDDWFMREIMESGMVLYEKNTREWVRKAEKDLLAAKELAGADCPFYDQICNFCQQSAEKYLKGFLVEIAVAFKRTHDLEVSI